MYICIKPEATPPENMNTLFGCSAFFFFFVIWVAKGAVSSDCGLLLKTTGKAHGWKRPSGFEIVYYSASKVMSSLHLSLMFLLFRD
jgi:hypothetical protein